MFLPIKGSSHFENRSGLRAMKCFEACRRIEKHQVNERSRELGLKFLERTRGVAAIQRLLDIYEWFSPWGGNGRAGSQKRFVVVLLWKVLLLDRKAGTLKRFVGLALQFCGF